MCRRSRVVRIDWCPVRDVVVAAVTLTAARERGNRDGVRVP